MTRRYPFYPAWDGGKASDVIGWFTTACGRRWGFRSLGAYANRPMRNPAAKGALSVHATGWAVDLGYPATRAGRRAAVQAFQWLVEHSEALRVAHVTDYRFGAHGRAYRCSRGEGDAGVKIYTAPEAGAGGNWLHVEIENTWSRDDFEAAWRALPRPPKL